MIYVQWSDLPGCTAERQDDVAGGMPKVHGGRRGLCRSNDADDDAFCLRQISFPLNQTRQDHPMSCSPFCQYFTF